MKKSRTNEAILVITTGFIIIYLITRKPVFIYVAASVGLIGVLVKPLAEYIAIGWFRLADILNFVTSKIILSVVYFIVLVPVAALFRMFKKDRLKLRRKISTTWTERNHQYSSEDLKNTW